MTLPRIIPLLLAGGTGTRLWPVSRDAMPKQFLPLVGDRSTYQAALARVKDPDLFASPIVMTSDDFRFFARGQADELGIDATVVLEPMRRDSGPAIAAGSALALAREVERRAPNLATSKWWKEERHGVFVDYNQNAKDRTVASAYSVRPTPDARVSTPLAWKEVADCEPADFTLATVPARFKRLGDLEAGIDQHAGSLAGLLELFERQGLGDAPWPPHYRKSRSEPPRVRPSKRKHPLLEIGRARRKESALAGLERWKARHPQAAAHLEPADVLVDAMRGRYSTWTRIRINLQHVPEALRPNQETLDPNEKILSSS